MTDAVPLARVWLVANAASGSTEATVFETLTAQLEGQGVVVAGQTHFPGQGLPDAARLDAAGVDTLVICAGDGTINAAATAAGNWGGQCLVLPGGTMNGLAKALHGNATRGAILSAMGSARLVYPPIAKAEGRTALVGVILGPAASWVHAREGVRKGRFARAVKSARTAWARSFARTIRVADAPGRHRAIIVTPREGCLEYALISADRVTDAVRLGWNWLLGDWRNDAGVTVGKDVEVRVVGRRYVRALFDGEPVKLATPAVIRHGISTVAFLSTASEASA